MIIPPPPLHTQFLFPNSIPLPPQTVQPELVVVDGGDRGVPVGRYFSQVRWCFRGDLGRPADHLAAVRDIRRSVGVHVRCAKAGQYLFLFSCYNSRLCF